MPRLRGPVLWMGLLLCLSLPLSGCQQPGDAQSEDLAIASEPGTPERLRVLHERGLKARDRGINDAALSYFLEASEGGYGQSSLAAGKLYAAGPEGVPQDDAAAAAYYQRAVEQGAGYLAQLPLGLVYLKGRGVEADPLEAERWFRRGARTIQALEGVVKEGAEAQAEGGRRQLIARLFAPYETPPEFDAALAWAESLPDQSAEELYRQAIFYFPGGEGPDDPVLARELASYAADKGDPRAAYELARLRLDEYGDGDWDPNDQETIELLWEAASKDLAAAQRDLGRIYARRDAGLADRQRAYYWLLRARLLGETVEAELGAAEAALSETERAEADAVLSAGQAYLP